MKITTEQVTHFQATVWQYYANNRRSMPWRDNTQPYFILVSELMLQQTQVSRVVPKFEAFVKRFPTVVNLAAAPLSEVLMLWSGLGYNRRARFLHEAAKQIVERFDAELPAARKDLESLPGVGPNTAGAILAYAYNQPVVFIETNIRTVYFHHFFADRDDISDQEVRTVAEQTLDRARPREWYWALMDYGTYLKQQKVGDIARSRHYKKQSTFAGSLRQVRGHIIRELLAGPVSDNALAQAIQDERYFTALEGLQKDGLVEIKDHSVHLTGAQELP